eukprot:3722855-Pyramimonas_sp.AAC.1
MAGVASHARSVAIPWQDLGLRRTGAGIVAALKVDAMVASGFLWIALHAHDGQECKGGNLEPLEDLGAYLQSCQ